ncbi:acyltransferase family protein [Bradyrhizobium roseum]|uniref:acyltransferase family protein n=1 Tax=Bradyrhizobium roseum TaxID=3056648 RepID=UPI0026365FFA|nr:acyltransferase [Bradyrhizobium roseus]WKA26394.1 acyltransferase [Bradyrhizobium roseus]
MLDVLRAGAAQMVCVGHAVRFFSGGFGQRWPLPHNTGVVLFFILSGFLITYTLIERSKEPSYGFGTFLIERTARIYSGLIPALFLVVIVDGIVLHFVNDRSISFAYNLQTFLANLAMFDSYRGSLSEFSITQWPQFGSATPLWTLAIEWHIYLFVAAIFFMGRKPSAIPLLIPVAILFGQMPSHYIFYPLKADGVGQGLLIAWLLGSYVYFISPHIKVPALAAAGAVVVSIACYLLSTGARAEYKFTSYLALAILLLFLVQASQATRIAAPRVTTAVRFCAGYSFTLYLIHHTLMYAVFVLGYRGHTVAIGMIIISNVVAAAIAIPTEMKHKTIARFLSKLATATADEARRRAAAVLNLLRRRA